MARRKITEASEPSDELPELTNQQQQFVEGILSGKTASDSYRAAYNTENMQRESVWAKASQLRADVKVAVWLSAARKAGLGHARVTLESHLLELDRLKEIAVESGNIGAAVQAEQIRGKAAGLHVEQHRELPPDPLAALNELRSIDPDFAAKLEAESKVKH